MSAEDFLASLGIQVGVASPPTIGISSNEFPSVTTYPTGTVSTLAVTAGMSWMWLGYLAFRFRRLWLRYIRDRFEFALSSRTDLQLRLTYEFMVGSELHSTVTVNLNRVPEPVVLENVELPTIPYTAEDELSEVVVE